MSHQFAFAVVVLVVVETDVVEGVVVPEDDDCAVDVVDVVDVQAFSIIEKINKTQIAIRMIYFFTKYS